MRGRLAAAGPGLGCRP